MEGRNAEPPTSDHRQNCINMHSIPTKRGRLDFKCTKMHKAQCDCECMFCQHSGDTGRRIGNLGAILKILIAVHCPPLTRHPCAQWIESVQTVALGTTNPQT